VLVDTHNELNIYIIMQTSGKFGS